MDAAWIEITSGGQTRREALRPGLTRVGGGGAEIVLDGVGLDQLHIWDSPARLIFVGTGSPPLRNGAPFEEVALLPGDRIEWGGSSLACGGGLGVGREAAFEEVPLAPPPSPTSTTPASITPIFPGAPPPAGPAPLTPISPAAPILPMASSGPPAIAAIPPAPGPLPIPPAPAVQAGERERLAWDRVRAGMLVDLGLVDKRVCARWQAAVKSQSFDPDSCAREILACTTVPPDEPRLMQRSGLLLRDFVMAPLLRGVKGAERRARETARGGIAYLLAQAMAFGIYALLVLITLILIRFRGSSIDGFLDMLLFRD